MTAFYRLSVFYNAIRIIWEIKGNFKGNLLLGLRVKG